jgi:hypothetical protein
VVLAKAGGDGREEAYLIKLNGLAANNALVNVAMGRDKGSKRQEGRKELHDVKFRRLGDLELRLWLIISLFTS